MSLISVGETGGREGENRMGLTAGTFLDRFVGRDKHYLFTQWYFVALSCPILPDPDILVSMRILKLNQFKRRVAIYQWTHMLGRCWQIVPKPRQIPQRYKYVEERVSVGDWGLKLEEMRRILCGMAELSPLPPFRVTTVLDDSEAASRIDKCILSRLLCLFLNVDRAWLMSFPNPCKGYAETFFYQNPPKRKRANKHQKISFGRQINS